MSPHPPKRPAAPKAISPQADTSPLPVGDQRPSHEMIQKNHRLSKRSARLITAVHHNIPASKSEDLHRFSNSRVCRPFFHPVALHKARPAMDICEVDHPQSVRPAAAERSEERRVGKERGSTCRVRVEP